MPKSRRPGTSLETGNGNAEVGKALVRASTNGHDLEGLTRPLLEALAKLASFESTYLVVFDWVTREQEVRVVHSAGKMQVSEGMRLLIPDDLGEEATPGVTRSPADFGRTTADSLVAKDLGLKTYVSVPVNVARHQLWGMLCGASREAREVSESTVTVMEFFARIISDHVTRSQTDAAERRADVAEERLRARARYLARAEHELKTPLATLEGTALTLLERWAKIPEHQRLELLEAMVRNSRGLTRWVEELLVEARSDVRARELAPVEVDLQEFLVSIAGAFDAVGETHVVAQVPTKVVASIDPQALYQVVGHLLDNAIKYSPEGGTITLRVDRTLRDIRIDVIDEGSGIPEDVDIFEPFRRGEGADVTSGVGLGLHIVRNLVEAMGGSVSAKRNAVAGSTFTVHVPAAL